MTDSDASGVTPFWPQSLTVRGPIAVDGGYPENTRNIIRGLLAVGVQVRALDSTGSAIDRLEPWLRPLVGPLGRSANPGILLDVNDPTEARSLRAAARAVYAMFEGTRLPPRWAAAARRAPATIVPSRHSWQLWRDAGVGEERLRIVRHGIDTQRFDGSAAPWGAPSLPDGSPFASRRTRMLQLFGIGPRKNTEGLLTAWLLATRADDDAALLLKATGWGAAEEAELVREIAGAERRAGKPLAAAAPVVWHRAPLAREEMPGLYTACTHYISASRGEGWDLGMTEAGASGLTLIAPAHTGYLAYLDETIATLIPARVEPARPHPDDIFAEFFIGNGWHEPETEALVTAIRDAVAGRPQATGAQARIRQRYTVRAAAAELLDALVSLWPEEAMRGR